MTKKEATEYLLKIADTIGCTAVERLTEKDADKMREAIYILTE